MRIVVLFFAVALVAGCTQLATEDLQEPVSQSSAVASLHLQGQELREQGQLQQAQASFERAVRLEPNNAVLWYELALLAYEQNRYQEAHELALRAQAFAGDATALNRKIDKLIGRVKNKQ